jgi:diguanylate cyclase (GGDEF)-like protein
VHDAVLLANLLGRPLNNEPLRFVDFAAPVYAADHSVKAVISSHVHWSWIGDVLSKSLAAEDNNSGVEAFILAADGNWLYPQHHMGTLAVPEDLPVAGQFGLLNWGLDGLFLTSRVQIHANTSNELGWQLVLRQPIAQALLPLTALQQKLMLICAVSMLVGMILAYRLAFQFSRPVAQLAQSAAQIVSGAELVEFRGQSSLYEVKQLNHALTGMMENLAEKRQALLAANASLEQQVQTRTADLLAANEALQALSRQDPLTGIHNRRAADERLQTEFMRMKRGEFSYALLLIDVDHFKKINDTFGHQIGDDVLKFVAERLQNNMRATDFVARYGGEEFIVILPLADEEGAKVFAEKLCADLASCLVPVVGKVTASFGGVVAKLADTSAETALRAADGAMYQAKQNGRNRVVFAG